MNVSIRSILLGATIASLAGCATHREAPTLQQQLAKRGYTQGETVRDIQNYRLNGWNYVDSRHLIIDTGPSDRYLVTLRVSCHELSSTQDIGFTSTAGKLTRFDSVLLRDSSGMRRDCPIEELQRLQKASAEDTADPDSPQL